jgi:hypothetical protein
MVYWIWSNKTITQFLDEFRFLYIWLGVMAIVMIAAPIVRKKRQKNALDERDFIVAAFALGGTITLAKILVKVIIDKKLQADLDWDGTLALCIGCGYGIYLAVKEVIKLF